jgi:hypothetical protein
MEPPTSLKSVCLILLLGLLCACSTAGATCGVEYVDQTMEILYKEKDPAKAKAHIEACAAQGDAASQIALAIVYLDDGEKNTIYDHQKGMALLEAAALQGYAPAQNEYAIILDNIKTKDSRTRELYRLRSLDWSYKAALQGHPDALYQIADTFEDHSLDQVSAYMWYLLALRRSKPEFRYHEFIVSALNQLKTRSLKPAEIEEAVRLADRWEKQHPRAAKSWPTDDYVENLNGASKALIPPPQPGPVKERFCDKFGAVITVCPQWNYKNDDKVAAFRKKFYGGK